MPMIDVYATVGTFEQGGELATELAHTQGALFWELRAALSTARLRIRQQNQADAARILQPVYDRFTEGFDMADLQSAKALLNSLQ